MNELQHNVTTFIEENNPCDTFLGLLFEMNYRYWNDEKDKVLQYFIKNPIEFTRLYEQMTDKFLK